MSVSVNNLEIESILEHLMFYTGAIKSLPGLPSF